MYPNKTRNYCMRLMLNVISSHTQHRKIYGTKYSNSIFMQLLRQYYIQYTVDFDLGTSKKNFN